MLSINRVNELEKENAAYKQSEQEAIEIIAELKHKNKVLKEKYTKVRKLAKENADANEYCLRELEALRDEDSLRITILATTLQQIKEIAEKEYYKKLKDKICFDCDESFNKILDLINQAERNVCKGETRVCEDKANDSAKPEMSDLSERQQITREGENET